MRLLFLLLAGALLLPGIKGAALQAPSLSLVLEDFESAALRQKPYLWKENKSAAQQATIGAVAADLDGDSGNKALQIDYTFPAAFAADQVVEAGPVRQTLPGSLAALELAVRGDEGKNGLSVRIRDRLGETFEWRRTVDWKGWQKVTLPLDPAAALRSMDGKSDGKLDPPAVFEFVRLSRLRGGARTGSIAVDNLVAVTRPARIHRLFDVADGVHPERWRANRNRATIGVVAESLVPRDGKEIPALKLEYEYEPGEDSSVEYQCSLPAGAGHGTLVVDLYGDGSNNLVRFRMLDGQDRVWQGTWTLALVDWSGWKTIYIDTRTLREVNGQDPGAMIDRFPVKFHSLLLDDCSGSDALPGVESGRKGEVFLGRILYCED